MKPLSLLAIAACLLSVSAFAEPDNLVSVINRDLHDDTDLMPRQFLKRNHGTNVVLNEYEMACFERQKKEMDDAAKDAEVKQKLKELKVPRMTFHLLSGAKDRGVNFNWNTPRRYNSPGGNYLIVKFGMNGGRCYFSSATDIKRRVIDGKSRKLGRMIVMEDGTMMTAQEAAAAKVKAVTAAKEKQSVAAGSLFRAPANAVQVTPPKPRAAPVVNEEDSSEDSEEVPVTLSEDPQ